VPRKGWPFLCDGCDGIPVKRMVEVSQCEYCRMCLTKEFQVSRKMLDRPLLVKARQCSARPGSYLHVNIQDTAQLINIGLTPCTSQNTLGSEFVQFSNISRQDLISGGQPRVCSYNGIVFSANSKCCSSVEIIRREASFVGSLCDTMVNVICRWVTVGGCAIVIVKGYGDCGVAFRGVYGHGHLPILGLKIVACLHIRCHCID
jgi:hypothetical protein